MMDDLVKLSGRIRAELSDLQRIAVHAVRRLEKSFQDEDYLGSVAFDLQSFYQAIERIFTIVAATIDGSVPSGENWHRDLLDQMSGEVAGRRPAVISAETKESLQAFRRFRHVGRNVYAFELDPLKIRSLAERIQETCGRVGSELLAFAEFLSRASSATKDD